MTKLTEFRKERLNQLLKGAGIEPDTFDASAYWDAKLTYGENVANISKVRNVQLLSQQERDRIAQSEAEGKEIQSRQAYETQIKAAEAEALKGISAGTNQILDSYYQNLRSLVRIIAKKHSHGLFIVGDGAIGKTHTVLTTLSKEGLDSNQDFSYFSGYLTPLSLYHHLFDNRDKLVVLDDVEGLDDQKTISLLKSAMWSASGERVVSYKTTSKQLTAPSQFIFTGGIIVCSNQLPRGRNKESIDALISRAFLAEINFSYADKMRILAEITATVPYKGLTQDQRKEVFAFLAENSNETTRGINIRLLLKSFDAFASGEEWKGIVKSMLNEDERLACIKKILRISGNVGEQVRMFQDETGYSRATFFRLKKFLDGSLNVSIKKDAETKNEVV
jgi:hypothetical protein